MSQEGKIQIFMSTAWDLQALLYNFDVNSPLLKTEHDQWIQATIKVHKRPKGVDTPPQRTLTMSALICGLASRTGPDALNWELSQNRAKAVSDAIWRLDPSTFLIETRFGLGEEAARLAGLRDNTEDEKWRSVFLRLYDPTKIMVSSVDAPKPPTYVNRPSQREFLAEFKTSSIFQDKADKRGDAIADAVRDQMAKHNWKSAKIDEKMISVPQNYKISLIQTILEDGSTNLGVASATVRVCRVDYHWGVPSGTAYLSNGYWRMQARRPPTVRGLSQSEVEAWVNNPYKALHDTEGRD